MAFKPDLFLTSTAGTSSDIRKLYSIIQEETEQNKVYIPYTQKSHQNINSFLVLFCFYLFFVFVSIGIIEGFPHWTLLFPNIL